MIIDNDKCISCEKMKSFVNSFFQFLLITSTYVGAGDDFIRNNDSHERSPILRRHSLDRVMTHAHEISVPPATMHCNEEIKLKDIPCDILKIIFTYSNNRHIHKVNRHFFQTATGIKSENILQNGIPEFKLIHHPLNIWNYHLNYLMYEKTINQIPSYFLAVMISNIIDLPVFKIPILNTMHIKTLSYVNRYIFTDELTKMSQLLKDTYIENIIFDKAFFKQDEKISDLIINHTFAIGTD